VDVWLPPGYPTVAPRYPVLYMHDGQNLFLPEEANTGIDWGIDPALADLIARRVVPPAIVVGIGNTAQRQREYMPQKPLADGSPAEERALQDSQLDGPPMSDAYLRFLLTELKPLVDHTYPTRPEREATFIMGSSMGGLISLYALCEYPAYFAGAGCLSTHWPAGAGIVVDYLRTALPRPGSHKIYFDHGTETLDALYAPYQQQVDVVMATAGYTAGEDWITRLFPGARHDEASWRERVTVPLTFLLSEG
jgi:predicted alpha/beta superfamily hydrolase